MMENIMGFHVDPRDERLHVPLDSPAWRESFWLDAHDSERNLSLVIYAHARPPAHRGDLFVCITGPEVGRIEHNAHDLPYAGPHEGVVAAVDGFRHVFLRPSQEVGFSLALPQVQLDLTFAAHGPVYDYDWESWTASRHVEQFGIVQGSLVTPTRRLVFNGPATRDHAWGARAKVPWRRWVWITARFPGDRGWSACIVDAEQPLLFGYHLDGRYEEATFASLKCQQSGESLECADLALAGPGFATRAAVELRARMPRSGTDPTKGGAYDYYFVDVHDEKFGSGQGLLNIYTTPHHELRDGDTICAAHVAAD
jgi:hypothetical protein